MVIKMQSNKMNDSKQILTSDMCRICMVSSDHLLDVINYELTPNICKMLRTCTQLKVEVDERLPKILCNTCYKQLNATYNFINLAKKSNKEIKKLMRKVPSTPEKIPRINDVLIHTNIFKKEDTSPNKSIIIHKESPPLKQGKITNFFNSDISIKSEKLSPQENVKKRISKRLNLPAKTESLLIKTELIAAENNLDIFVKNEKQTPQENKRIRRKQNTENVASLVNIPLCKDKTNVKKKLFPQTNKTRKNKVDSENSNIPIPIDLCVKNENFPPIEEIKKKLSLKLNSEPFVALENINLLTRKAISDSKKKKKSQTKKRLSFETPVVKSSITELIERELKPRRTLIKKIEQNKNSKKPKCPRNILEQISKINLDLVSPKAEIVDTVEYRQSDKPKSPQLKTLDNVAIETAQPTVRRMSKRLNYSQQSEFLDDDVKFDTSLDILHAVGLMKTQNRYEKFNCKICSQKFYWIEPFKRHLSSVHNLSPFICKYCGEKFQTRPHLTRHRDKLHSGNTPYRCLDCEINFKNLENLTIHIRKEHIGKSPFTCKICKKGCEDKDKLQLHVATHFKKVSITPPQRKMLKCSFCPRLFRKTGDLNRHERVHTGVKPFKCRVCKATFQQAYSLTKHAVRHSKEKCFTCDICKKTFGRNDTLLRHMITHSIQKPYLCTTCDRTFARHSQLAIHIKNKHITDTPVKREDIFATEDENYCN